MCHRFERCPAGETMGKDVRVGRNILLYGQLRHSQEPRCHYDSWAWGCKMGQFCLVRGFS